jgi:hypothetical protein
MAGSWRGAAGCGSDRSRGGANGKGSAAESDQSITTRRRIRGSHFDEAGARPYGALDNRTNFVASSRSDLVPGIDHCRIGATQ